MFRLSTFGFLSLALALLFSGCGAGSSLPAGPKGSVTGTVTFEGKPVPEGARVQFYNPDLGFGANGVVQSNGTFQVKSTEGTQIPTGTYQVSVTPPASSNEPLSPEEAMRRYEAGEIEAEASVIPRKYVNPSTSGLEFNVQEGPNNFDIELD